MTSKPLQFQNQAPSPYWAELAWGWLPFVDAWPEAKNRGQADVFSIEIENVLCQLNMKSISVEPIERDSRFQAWSNSTTPVL